MLDCAAGSIRSLLDDDVREIVAAAASDGGMVRARKEARRLAKTYPASGLSEDEINDAVIRAAVSAGVAAELSGGSSTE
jgi:hypothetical protein